MWKWYVFFLVFVFVLVKFVSTSDTTDQRKQTSLMDKHCLKSPKGLVPFHVLLWGPSDTISEHLFDILQKSECPRRIRITVFDSEESSAAATQNRSVKIRGTFDTPFDDQISWITAKKDSLGFNDQLLNQFKNVKEPLTLMVQSDMKQQWTSHWDAHLLDTLPNVSSSQILTLVPNEFSRLEPLGTLDVEWKELSRNHLHKCLRVMFPSHALFGTTLQMKTVVEKILREWPEMTWNFWPMVAPFLSKEFLGIVLFEKGLFQVGRMPRLSPKESKILRSKYPNLETFFSESHSLGLDPEDASQLEIILKYGSLKELQKNVLHVREDKKGFI